MKKKTHEWFITKLATGKSPLKLMDGQTYQGSLKKLSFVCPKGHVVSVIPRDVLRGTGCILCRKKPTKSHKQFEQELVGIAGISLAPGAKYVHSKIPVKFMCNLGHIWETAPYNVLSSNTGCPVCSQRKKKSTDEFRDECNTKNNKLRLLEGEEYVNNKVKLKFICNNGHTISVAPYYVLSGGGCSICSRKKKKLLIPLNVICTKNTEGIFL